MTIIHDVASLDLFHRLGWVLLHSVWQFTLIAMVLAAAIETLRRRSASLRYTVCCLALSGTMLASITTFFLVPGLSPDRAAVVASESPVVPTRPAWATQSTELATMSENTDVGFDPPPRMVEVVPPQNVDAESLADAPETTSVSPATGTEGPATTRQPLTTRWIAAVRPWLPAASLAWLSGVLLLSLWNVGGWLGAMRLQRVGVTSVTQELADQVEVVARRMRLRQAVRLLRSTLVEVPVVIGWWRPVLLVPAAMIAGLSPQQLDAVLAHELAHVRRYDYLVNLLQTIVETLLFYHPAVWWISHQVRVAREHCCDDAAIDVCGDSVAYAAALSSFEALRSAPRPALAANAGNTLARVQRILGVSTRRDRLTKSLAGSFVVVTLIAVFIACTVWAGEKSATPGETLSASDIRVSEEQPDATRGSAATDEPAPGNAGKKDSSLTTLENLVYVDVSSGHAPQHPLVRGPGRDFPSGRELAFRRPESREWVHAVFPKEVTAPEKLDGKFVLHGRFQGIQNMASYTMKKPGKDYRYFVVSSWERMEISRRTEKTAERMSATAERNELDPTNSSTETPEARAGEIPRGEPLDIVVRSLKRLADQHLPGHEFGRDAEGRIRIAWKTRTYDLPEKENKTGALKVRAGGPMTGPEPDGLILEVWTSERAGTAVRPQTIDNAGIWKTLLGRYVLPSDQGPLKFDLHYGPKTDRTLIEVFLSPEDWLAVNSPEPAWGEAVEGAQCRLTADQRLWKPGDTVVLAAELRNNGELDLKVKLVGVLALLEVDGVGWHMHSIHGEEGHAVPWSDFGPGKAHRDVLVRVDTRQPRSRYDAFRHRVPLAAGRHTIRAAFEMLHGHWRTGKRLRVVSNPVTIELDPAANGWSKPADGLIGRLTVAMATIHPSEQFHLKLDLRNVNYRGEPTLAVNTGNPFLFEARMTDADGAPVEPTMKRSDVNYSAKWTVIRRLGERVTIPVSVRSLDGPRDRHLNTTRHVRRLPPGKYKIAGTFSSPKTGAYDGPGKPWLGKLELPAVEVEIEAGRSPATQAVVEGDSAHVAETAATPPKARAVAAGWEPALTALRQAAKDAPVRQIDNEWSRNALTNLFQNGETRIYQVVVKPSRQYVLRKGDERIYLFGNADDMLALAKAENVVLPDEQKIQLFGVLLKFGDQVIKRSQHEWELHYRLSGIRGVSFRVLTLDDKNRPVAIGPRQFQRVSFQGGRTRLPATPHAGEGKKPPTRPEDVPQAVASFQTFRIDFRATIESIQPLGKYGGTVTNVDRDPRYIVVVSIRDVEQQKVPIQAGRKRAFAIHSPARLFGTAEQTIGETYRFTITYRTGPPASFSDLRVADNPPPPGASQSRAHVIASTIRGFHQELTKLAKFFPQLAGIKTVKPSSDRLTFANGDIQGTKKEVTSYGHRNACLMELVISDRKGYVEKTISQREMAVIPTQVGVTWTFVANPDGERVGEFRAAVEKARQQCISRMHTQLGQLESPRTHESPQAVTEKPSVRQQLGVPDGVMLCVVKYPGPSARQEDIVAFHAAMARLDKLLGSSKIEYGATGFLVNHFYIRSDHERAKAIILRAMKDERFEIEFY